MADGTCPVDHLFKYGPFEPIVNLNSADAIIQEPDGNPYFQSHISSGGDTNGDGIDDFLLDADARDYITSYTWIYRSAPTGVFIIGEFSDALIHSTSGVLNSGAAIDLTKDLDGDGLSDILTGSAFENTPEGLIVPGASYIISGLLRGVWEAEDVVSHTFWGEVDGDRFGGSVASVGDINNDGVSEVLVGSPYWGPYLTGAAFLFSSPHRVQTYTTGATATLMGTWGDFYHYCNPPPIILCENVPRGSQTGEGVLGMGDITGDGLPDLGIISGGDVHVLVDGTTRGESVVTDSGVSLEIGVSLRTATGDLDGDGAADFYVAQNYGKVSYCRLRPNDDTTPELSCEVVLQLPVDEDGRVELGAVSSADLTGDGVQDLIVGWPEMTWEGEEVGGVVVVSGVDIIKYVRRVEAGRGAPAP